MKLDKTIPLKLLELHKLDIILWLTFLEAATSDNILLNCTRLDCTSANLNVAVSILVDSIISNIVLNNTI
jgi:hypothetical protein